MHSKRTQLRLWLIRHGEYEKKGSLCYDGSLTQNGILQANELRLQLNSVNTEFRMVVASHMNRAINTAAIVADVSIDDVVRVTGLYPDAALFHKLTEALMGCEAGITTHQFFSKELELMHEIGEAAYSGLAKTLREHGINDGNVLVGCHNVTILCLMSQLFGGDLNLALDLYPQKDLSFCEGFCVKTEGLGGKLLGSRLLTSTSATSMATA